MDKAEQWQIEQLYRIIQNLRAPYIVRRPRNTQVTTIDLLGLVEAELADGFPEISPLGLAERSEYAYSAESIGRALRRIFPTAARRRTSRQVLYTITPAMLRALTAAP